MTRNKSETGIINFIQNSVQKKRSGEAGIEWFIVAPLFLFMCICCFFLWGMSSSYTTMSHVASNIAQDINIRRTGAVENESYGINNGLFYTGSYPSTIINPENQQRKKVYFNSTSNGVGYEIMSGYKMGLVRYIYQNPKKFFVPFVSDKIKINLNVEGEPDTLSRDGYFGVGSLKPGSKIYVDINYTAMGIPIKASGVNIVT